MSQNPAVAGSGDKGVSRAIRKQEGEGQEHPHAFACLQKDATCHCADRQAIGAKPEKWAHSLRNGPASYKTAHVRERDGRKEWKEMFSWVFCDARGALRRQKGGMG